MRSVESMINRMAEQFPIIKEDKYLVLICYLLFILTFGTEKEKQDLKNNVQSEIISRNNKHEE